MIYKVTIKAPPILEVVTTSATSAEQAKTDAINSAMQRWIAAAEVTVEEADA
jgi:hypothetical protein